MRSLRSDNIHPVLMDKNVYARRKCVYCDGVGIIRNLYICSCVKNISGSDLGRQKMHKITQELRKYREELRANSSHS